MQVRDVVETLSILEKEGSVSPALASEIMSNILILEQYPEFLVVSGEANFSFIRHRYGDMVMITLMTHIEKSLASKAVITNYQFIDYLPMEVVQDAEVRDLVFTLYFKLWREMRTRCMECFPYEFSTLGATSVLFTQHRGNRLLEFAGL